MTIIGMRAASTQTNTAGTGVGKMTEYAWRIRGLPSKYVICIERFNPIGAGSNIQTRDIF